jgi:opacity protein-like surface antigen
MKKFLLLFSALLLSTTPALAAKYDISLASSITNAEFAKFVRQAGTLTAYRAVAPAEPLGVLGFDIGIESSFVKLDDSAWQAALNQGNTEVPEYLPAPRLHLRKGLPFGIDVGASYTQVPSSDIAVFGAELQYALLKGSVATPALALRANYSKLVGVDEIDLQTYGADAVISKGFAMLTPYGGIGYMHASGSYEGTDSTLKSLLKDQDFGQMRYFAGLQVSMMIVNLTLEAELNDEAPVYTAKISLGW